MIESGSKRVPEYSVCDEIRALDRRHFFETFINLIDKLGNYFDFKKVHKKVLGGFFFC